MPRVKVDGELSFRYGKTWQAEATADAHAYRLFRKSESATKGSPAETWWVLWNRSSDARAVWGHLSAPPQPAGIKLTALRAPNDDLFTLQPRSRRLVHGEFEGFLPEALAVYVRVAGLLLGHELDGALDIYGIGILGMGDRDAIQATYDRTLSHFLNGVRFGPHRRAFEDELRREDQARQRRMEDRRQREREEEARRRAADQRRPAPATPSPSPSQPVPGSSPARQCGICSGSGWVTCGACGGLGYHTTTTTQTDWDGNFEYITENVPCGCGGGRSLCGSCSGSGRN